MVNIKNNNRKKNVILQMNITRINKLSIIKRDEIIFERYSISNMNLVL